ncbi:hypothetical protein [Micromonospora sp. C41]|nr:hypothetical protein [Micromonospora sp. C41]
MLEQALWDAHANEAPSRQSQRRLLKFIHVWQIRKALVGHA